MEVLYVRLAAIFLAFSEIVSNKVVACFSSDNKDTDPDEGDKGDGDDEDDDDEEDDKHCWFIVG
jgi:hypothetical protein